MSGDAGTGLSNPRRLAFVPFDTSGQASIHQDERLVGTCKIAKPYSTVPGLFLTIVVVYSTPNLWSAATMAFLSMNPS